MIKRQLNILVVDDDKNFAHTLCEILKTEGYNSKEVNSVKEAQALIMEELFDCVLSDVKMPDKSGAELYMEIKDRFPNLPFILMTAYTSSEIIDEAIQSGVITALNKPINIKEILEFFAKLSQTLEAAIISENEKNIQKIQDNFLQQKITYTVYKSIEQIIQSKRKDFSIVLIDTQKDCEHFSSKIDTLLNHLPRRTIVVICNYANKKDILPERFNIITLPREEKSYNEIGRILAKEIYQYAKESIK
jgi:CheY-like chemotaxis protein